MSSNVCANDYLLAFQIRTRCFHLTTCDYDSGRDFFAVKTVLSTAHYSGIIARTIWYSIYIYCTQSDESILRNSAEPTVLSWLHCNWLMLVENTYPQESGLSFSTTSFADRLEWHWIFNNKSEEDCCNQKSFHNCFAFLLQ
jgi:hypothetical protein